MTLLDLYLRYKNVNDARDILVCRWATAISDSPAQQKLAKAIDWLDGQLKIMQDLLLEDPGGFCSECKVEVESQEAHEAECHDDSPEFDDSKAAGIAESQRLM